MDQALNEKFERQLQDFTNKRDKLEQAVAQMKDGFKNYIDKMFEEIFAELNTRADDVGDVIEESIKEFKALTKKRQEISAMREKLESLVKLVRDTPNAHCF